MRQLDNRAPLRSDRSYPHPGWRRRRATNSISGQLVEVVLDVGVPVGCELVAVLRVDWIQPVSDFPGIRDPIAVRSRQRTLLHSECRPGTAVAYVHNVSRAVLNIVNDTLVNPVTGRLVGAHGRQKLRLEKACRIGCYGCNG